MDSNRDRDQRILVRFFCIALLVAGARHLNSPKPMQPLLPSVEEKLMRDSEGNHISILEALPPDGTGFLLLFRLRAPLPVLRAAISTWETVRRDNPGPVAAILITRREKGIRNLTGWLEMAPVLRMDPDIFHSRFRVPGLPVVLRLESGHIVSNQVVLP